MLNSLHNSARHPPGRNRHPPRLDQMSHCSATHTGTWQVPGAQTLGPSCVTYHCRGSIIPGAGGRAVLCFPVHIQDEWRALHDFAGSSTLLL